jgi:hypothetical protein
MVSDTQKQPRGHYAEPITQQGTMFSFFKSYYVDDTAFILLSRGEVIAAKLIVSHFRRFGLTIHTGSKRKRRRLENGGPLSEPGQESSAADMEDIEIDADRFMSFASSSNT